MISGARPPRAQSQTARPNVSGGVRALGGATSLTAIERVVQIGALQVPDVDLRPAPSDLVVANRRVDDVFGVKGRLRQNLAPGTDNHRVPVRRHSLRRGAGLGGRHDVGVTLDRPGADQYLPVNTTGRYRKGRRNSEHRGAVQGQLAVQLRKAQIET